ncbi:adenylate/guanylate cyclase domain-containing protein [soil metagenome]
MIPTRRLAAIAVADVVGYSRLMEADEAGTLTVLKERRTAILEPVVRAHAGRLVKVMGDGVLIEFASAVNAVTGALELQRKMAAANELLPASHRIVLRIGINLGDVIGEGSDIYGDGVNIAARLESLAQPGGICVSAKVHDEVRGKTEAAFEDMGEIALKNIASPVRCYGFPPAGGAMTRPALALPNRPSIAVLAFANMSGDPEQEYFADGMVEEIITALSRMKWLFVIARNSSFTYKGRSVDVKQVGRELGVRYVLEGSVRKAGDKVRITGQLIDTATGNHIWANRYDGGLSDIFDLQDRIAESVAGAIQPSILSAEIERSVRKRPESLVAYDYVLRAFPLVWSLQKVHNEEAQTLLDRALLIEPAYPLALSLSAWCHAQRAVYNWTDSPAEAREEAIRRAQRAVAMSRDDPMVLAILGAAHTVARDYDIAGAHLERAVALDPNSAWAWNRSGWLNVHRECPDIALEQFDRAIRLSPFDPMEFICFHGIGAAYFVKGSYDEAILWIQKGLDQQPNSLWSLRVLVPALVHAGRIEDARRYLGKLTENYPGLSIGKIRDALPFGFRTMERIARGLQTAGLPN